MSRWDPTHTMLGLAGLLVLLPVSTRASFLIELNNGRTVTVEQYVDEGQAVQIYTSLGKISFQKDDIKQISEVDDSQVASLPLDADFKPLSHAPQGRDAEDLDSLETSPGVDQGSAAGVQNNAQSTALETQKPQNVQEKREKLEAQFHGARHEFGGIWDKHRRDVATGASEKVLAKNRERLRELDKKRSTLIRQARRTGHKDLPAWAR
jgi:hypothetical protein